jgi:hypothetical protein
MDTIGQLDTAKTAGLIVLGALGVLIALRKSFGGVTVKLGD